MPISAASKPLPSNCCMTVVMVSRWCLYNFLLVSGGKSDQSGGEIVFTNWGESNFLTNSFFGLSVIVSQSFSNSSGSFVWNVLVGSICVIKPVITCCPVSSYSYLSSALDMMCCWCSKQAVLGWCRDIMCCLPQRSIAFCQKICDAITTAIVIIVFVMILLLILAKYMETRFRTHFVQLGDPHVYLRGGFPMTSTP